MKYHPGPGKTHNLLYPVPHLRLVAMTAAVGAERLFFHKWTPVAALTGVFGQSRALRTEPRFGTMAFFAVDANHQGDDSFFLFTLFFNALFHRYHHLPDFIPILLQQALTVEQRFVLAIPLLFQFVVRDKPKRGGIDAITQTAGLRWTVVENVAKMGISAAAAHFCPNHPM